MESSLRGGMTLPLSKKLRVASKAERTVLIQAKESHCRREYPNHRVTAAEIEPNHQGRDRPLKREIENIVTSRMTMRTRMMKKSMAQHFPTRSLLPAILDLDRQYQTFKT